MNEMSSKASEGHLTFEVRPLSPDPDPVQRSKVKGRKSAAASCSQTIEEATRKTFSDEDYRQQGRMDCYQDRCENVPFASVGGTEAREAPRAPNHIPAERADAYLQGYTAEAAALFGSDWRTCSFAWRPAFEVVAP